MTLKRRRWILVNLLMSLVLKCIDHIRWIQPIYGLLRHFSKYYEKYFSYPPTMSI